MSAIARHKPAADDYLHLVRRLPLRVIRTAREHSEALKLLDEFAGREDLSPGQVDYLAVLGRLVEDYERSLPGALQQAAPLEVLRHLMEARGVTQARLGAVLGRSVASDVLRGRRELSKRHIRVLADLFGVSPAVFIGPQPPAPKPARG